MRIASVFPGVLGAMALLVACSGEIRVDPDESRGPGPAAGRGAAAGGVGAGPAGAEDPQSPAVQSPGAEDPGRVTLHRLNRVEYNNTVRDLLGTTLRPADDFPSDDRGYGYDNIADVLSLSPLQVEMYWNAATLLIDDAMAVGQVGATRYEAEEMESSTGSRYQSTGWNLTSAGSVQQVVAISAAGDYRVAVRAFQQQGGPDPARMTIDVDGQALDTFDVTADSSTPATFEVTTTLRAGSHIIGASFLNDYYDAANGIDRNLVIDFVELEGPLGARADNPLRARLMTCEPDQDDPLPCLREVATNFGRRAFRRPLEPAEVDALAELASSAIAAGDDVESATRLMLRGVMVSPHFIFRVELDSDPDSLAPHRLSDHELAARLSYFLWSSMPDAELAAAADAGELGSDDTLRVQVRRMLADEKAEALVQNFAGQWLFTRSLADHEPDYQAYPDFDETLRASMRTETERYFREFLSGDESMENFLTADFSFVDGRLARHYGMPEADADFTRRTFSGVQAEQRGGLLTQAGLLMVTSYPARTSPVKRGKWVLEQLMCSPPPPPPPGVEGLVKEEMPSGSLRERMEAHRANPVCASCHQQMDPIGFGFEHYDGIGAFRETDDGFAIEPAGQLPDGETFQGPRDLAALLAADPRYARCTVQQLLTYALGRGIDKSDAPHIDALTEGYVAGGSHLPDLIEAIALSEVFRSRRGEDPASVEAQGEQP